MQIDNIVIGAIIHSKKILLLKRKREPFINLWGMPGGKIELGESPDDAFIREVKEETGIAIVSAKIAGLLSETFFNTEAKRESGYSMIFVYKSLLSNSKYLESSEGELKWFQLNNLQSYKNIIIPSDYLMIKKFILKADEKNSVYKVKMFHSKNNYKIGETNLKIIED